MITKFKIFENNSSAVVIKILQTISQIQMYHWQTPKMNDHKTFDDFNHIFRDLSDKLIEIIQGKYGRVSLEEDIYTPLRNISDIEPITFIDNCILFFNSFRNINYKDDNEIVSVLDEIVGELQKLKYLLSFS
jgi:hypothetical protein